MKRDYRQLPCNRLRNSLLAVCCALMALPVAVAAQPPYQELDVAPAPADAGSAAANDADVAIERNSKAAHYPINLDKVASRMRVAVTPFRAHDIALEEELGYLRTRLESALFSTNRFQLLDFIGLIKLVQEKNDEPDRLDELTDIIIDGLVELTQEELEEQTNLYVDQFLELVLEMGSLAQFKAVNAFIITDVHKHDDDQWSLRAQVVHAERRDILATGTICIENFYDHASVAVAIDHLTQQLTAAFPHISGTVKAVYTHAAETFIEVDMLWADGVKEGTELLIGNIDEPWIDDVTGEILAPEAFYEIARARIDRIYPTKVRALVMGTEEGGPNIEAGHLAITL